MNLLTKLSMLIASIGLMSTSAYARVVPSGQAVEGFLGSGYDSEKEDFRGACLKGTSFKEEGKPESRIDFSQTITRDQLSKQLNLGASLAVRSGADNYSASADFMKSATANGFSIVAIYKADYRFKNLVLTKIEKSEVSQDIGKNPDRWRTTCGDEYVKQVGQGAKLFFSIRIDFASEEEKQSFDAAFRYKSSFAEVKAYLKDSKQSFSSNTAVRVDALQIGGDIEMLSEIFQLNSAGGSTSIGMVQCTFGDFSKCDKVLEAALEYGTNTKTGFASQLKSSKKDVQRASLFYVTAPYSEAGLFPPWPPSVDKVILQARERVETYFDDTALHLDRARSLLHMGVVPMSPKQRQALIEEEAKLSKQLKGIVAVATTCYNEPGNCLDEASTLEKGGSKEIQPPNEKVFQIVPETFLQYCRLANTIGSTPRLKVSIAGMIAVAKKMDPSKFTSQDATQPVDECVQTERVFRASETLDLSRQKISTVEPLQDMVHLVDLNVSNNELQDLKGLEGLVQLRTLNAARNRITALEPIATLPLLEEINISSNWLRDVEALNTLPRLIRLDLRANAQALECPANAHLKVCLKTTQTVVAEFAGGGYLPIPVFMPQISRLPNGSLFVSGALNGPVASESLLYNTGNDEFTRNVSLSADLSGHTATALPDGRVFVAGGYRALQTAQIVAPHAPLIPSVAVSMAQPRAGHTATLLPDGRVLLAGGIRGSVYDLGNANKTAEIFDPISLQTEIIALKVPRAFHTATLLADGRILLTGGFTAVGPAKSAELIDVKQSASREIKSGMTEARAFHSATVLANDRVLIAGGIGIDLKAIASIEEFNPVTNRFTALTEKLGEPRAYHSATRTQQDLVVFVGGSSAQMTFDSPFDSCETCIATAEIFDPSDSSLQPVSGRMISPRAFHQSSWLDTGGILILGGIDSPSGRSFDMLNISTEELP